MRRATYLLAWLLALAAYATVAVGILPLFIFIDEVEGRYGEVLSVVAFFVLPVGFASLAVWRLPEGYYRCHPFERRGRLYEMLGVRYFRMLVPHGDGMNWLVRRSQPGYRVVRDRLTLPSIPLHLYPVLLQRYTRARIARALART